MKKHKYLFLILALSMTSTICLAQKKKNKVPAFYSLWQAGLLQGQAGSGFQLQCINGIEFKSWYAGIGIGLDNYRFRSIPLFIDFRKDFSATGNGFFIYADAGIHFPWLSDKQEKDFTSFNGGDNFSKGWYTDAGVGYSVRLNSKTALILSSGYSYKESSSKTSIYMCPTLGPCYIDAQRFDYNLNRVSIKAGLKF